MELGTSGLPTLIRLNEDTSGHKTAKVSYVAGKTEVVQRECLQTVPIYMDAIRL